RVMNCLLPLLFVLSLGAAQKSARQTVEWDYKTEAEKVNLRGCANLTLVLDNWKYAIMTQVDLLLNDHSTVLTDYAGMIQPLSEALNDLYKEFNSLKERLAELTTKFEGIELFVDEARTGRKRCCNNVKYMKNNVFFPKQTPPKQNQDYVKEHNRTPLRMTVSQSVVF
uniref:Uncharacterized protein n=1 Tax=Sinocyclocheilus rhinocerous TaxID=307959 RepID=A0A673HVY4_9TELE